MKQLKDYLHLYLGCECYLYEYDGPNNDIETGRRKFRLTAYNLNYYKEDYHSIKPILRPLSDMTEEEKRELADLLTISYFEATRYAISKHLDIFNLIEAGLAIDKTNI